MFADLKGRDESKHDGADGLARRHTDRPFAGARANREAASAAMGRSVNAINTRLVGASAVGVEPGA